MKEIRVLFFNSPWTTPASQLGLLARPPFVVEEVMRAADLLRRLESARYAVVILRMPGDGIDFEDILPVIRSEKMPCSRAILVLLTPAARLDHCRPYLSQGLNALLPDSVSVEELEATVARQTQVAPRVTARVMVRLNVSIQQQPLAVVCQTLNLSYSGMFVASTNPPPVGSNLTFEMPLPGSPVPLAGDAWVVRHASVGREKQKGMAVAFTSLKQDGWHALRKFIDETLAKPHP